MIGRKEIVMKEDESPKRKGHAKGTGLWEQAFVRYHPAIGINPIININYFDFDILWVN